MIIEEENRSKEDPETGIPLLQDEIRSSSSVNVNNNNNVGSRSWEGASFWSGIFNISTTMIGAGIMSIPATFKVLGVIPSLVVILLVGLMGDITGEFILRFTGKKSKSSSSSTTTTTTNSNTYGGLMAESFGRAGSLGLQICVMITSFGCLIIYLIIIGDVLSGNKSEDIIHSGILQEWFGFYWWTCRPFAILFVLLLVILPLVLLRRVDSLRFTSALSILLALVFVVICSVMAIQHMLEGKTQKPRLMPDFSGQGAFLSLFSTFPVFLTAFGFQMNVHPIRAELREPSEMKLVIRIALLICAALYFCIGFFGYLLFGDSINSDMLVNFDQESDSMTGLVINAIVRLSYAFHLMLVFPLLFYTLRANVDELFFSNKPELAKHTTRFVCLTCILLILAYVIAIAIPSIWLCFQILGSTTVVCVILVFPSSIVLRDIHGTSTLWDKVVATLLILVALATSAVTMWNNLHTPVGSKT